MIQLLRNLDQPGGWSVRIRSAFCCVAALLSALDLGFQGNGNLVWSGVFLGFALGLAWPVFLLFGLPLLVRGFRPLPRLLLCGASWIAALALFVAICFQIWGH
jgi:hypothetical protein